MKRYFINVHYDASVTIAVDAENEKEALEMAKNRAGGDEFDSIDYMDACVVEEAEISDYENQ
jgi:hypothetical protein